MLQPEAERDGEGVHDPGQGRPLLGDLDEDLARAAVLVLADRHVALAVGHPEGERLRVALAGQALAHRANHERRRRPLLLVGQGRLELGDACGDLAVVRLGLRTRRRQIATFTRTDRGGLLLGRRQRLGHLAVVAVDGHRLDPQAPGVDVQLLDVLDRHVLGHVDGLGDGAADEGLHRPHHADVARVVDGVVAHGAGEDGQVLGSQVRRADDRHVLVDVRHDVLGLFGPVAQLGQRARHRLVDDRHRPAADELLRLDEPEVGLDARRVAVHQQADGVVADETVRDVGDVARHGHVIGELVLAQFHRADRVVEEAEQVAELGDLPSARTVRLRYAGSPGSVPAPSAEPCADGRWPEPAGR